MFRLQEQHSYEYATESSSSSRVWLSHYLISEAITIVKEIEFHSKSMKLWEHVIF